MLPLITSDLMNAVVEQAVYDYRKSYIKRDKKTRAECEAFFLSGRFNLFTGLDGKVLLDRLKKETNEERREYLKKDITERRVLI